jgi:hypothetical protein
MSTFSYVCPRCHHRELLLPGMNQPQACPACGLNITHHELTQQRTTSNQLGRKALTMLIITWVIGLLLVLALISALVRIVNP